MLAEALYDAESLVVRDTLEVWSTTLTVVLPDTLPEYDPPPTKFLTLIDVEVGHILMVLLEDDVRDDEEEIDIVPLIVKVTVDERHDVAVIQYVGVSLHDRVGDVDCVCEAVCDEELVPVFVARLEADCDEELVPVFVA